MYYQSMIVPWGRSESDEIMLGDRCRGRLLFVWPAPKITTFIAVSKSRTVKELSVFAHCEITELEDYLLVTPEHSTLHNNLH